MDDLRTKARRTRVSEIMTTAPIVLYDDDTVEQAGRTLMREGISGAPVVDEHGRLVGVFTKADLLARFASPRERRSAVGRLDDRHAHALTVGDACTRPPVITSPDATVDTAARELLDHDIGRIIVVSAGRIVGVVSRTDLLKLLLPTWDEGVSVETVAAGARPVPHVSSFAPD